MKKFLFSFQRRNTGSYVITKSLSNIIIGIVAISSATFILAILFISDPVNNVFFLMFITLLVSSLFYISLALTLYFKILNPMKRVDRTLHASLDELPVSSTKTFINKLNMDQAVSFIIQEQKKAWHRELKLEFLKKDAELNALQSQINPHFLYNTLDAIRGYALIHDVPEIAIMVEKLSSLFRNATKHAGTLISLKDELQNIENYIAIQQFRFPGKFSFFVDIPAQEKDEILDYKIPILILQPLIENALYHGMESLTSEGQIHLYVNITQSRIIIKIIDNGVGIPQIKLDVINDMLSKGTDADLSDNKNVGVGIALSNINQRIKHQFGIQYGISVASTVKIGTEVELTLPLLK